MVNASSLESYTAICLFCGFSDIHPLIKEHGTLRAEATFSRYELACGNASSYPENVASARRVGTCRFCMHLISRKNYFNTIRIEITSERQNDQLQTKETD